MDERLVTRRRRGGRIARRERLGDGLVVRVPVVDPEGLERGDERVLRLPQRYAILGPTRARKTRLDRRQVELDHLRVRRMVLGVVPEHVFLAVGLDERDPRRRPAGQSQVLDRLLVDREEAACGTVLRGHVP